MSKAGYLDSPKGAGLKKKATAEMKVRRRLSVVGGGKMDGIRHRLSGLEVEDFAIAADHDESSGGGTTHIASAKSVKGYAPYNSKKVNQDSLINFEEEGFTFYGALDGHGEYGHKVSQYLVKQFEAGMRASIASGAFTTGPGEVAARMSEQLLSDEAYLNSDQSCIDTEYSGTTMTIGCLYMRGGKEHLTAVNAGDSRLIFGTLDEGGRLGTIEVTEDHKPDLPAEKKRILAFGGRVHKLAYPGIDPASVPARVWLMDRDIPGLAMSRSLGDMCAHRAGVISEPECFEVDIPKNVRYMCVASDGLWEFMDNEEVLEIIHKHVGEAKGTPQVLQGLLGKANDELKEVSHELWMQEEQVVDDTSMVCALFNLC